jgi:hypothetical protein
MNVGIKSPSLYLCMHHFFNYFAKVRAEWSLKRTRTGVCSMVERSLKIVKLQLVKVLRITKLYIIRSNISCATHNRERWHFLSFAQQWRHQFNKTRFTNGHLLCDRPTWTNYVAFCLYVCERSRKMSADETAKHQPTYFLHFCSLCILTLALYVCIYFFVHTFFKFVANAFISHFQHTNNAHQVILYTTALLYFPKNLIPWRDSNPGLLVPEADAMSTAPRRQGNFFYIPTYQL